MASCKRTTSSQLCAPNSQILAIVRDRDSGALHESAAFTPSPSSHPPSESFQLAGPTRKPTKRTNEQTNEASGSENSEYMQLHLLQKTLAEDKDDKDDLGLDESLHPSPSLRLRDLISTTTATVL
ncbi:hypothetical protein SCHPADRAFT_891824 [Schizopora paradoxa]|uniref:Uncharacterized protein n=1 Tax=Schizopora paradoxa TaxID=27342 RepID=A0A0H2S280_9AGAM|nr:hypothetical protein SCHPADRAFT_891824 [Schizopora paradoxa]